jgi:capsular exopolysaccharide synthesis family protein
MFFTRFKETDAAAFEAANARFVDRAVKPINPVKPRKALIVALAGVLSILAGIMLAFLRDMLDNTIKVSAEVESKLRQPVIGVLPLIRTRNKEVDVSSAVLDASQQGFAEAVRTTRTGIVLSGLDKTCKKVVFTSSVPKEGKTTLSMNIAFAFGQMEKVVLVDADMRRPSVAENCGFEHRAPGLSNIIAQTHQLKECTYEYKGIDVIPAGIVPPNPLELLSSNRFQSLLMVLDEEYDRIIIDAAPTQAVSDSLMLSQMADGVVYVVRADSTPTDVASAGISRLLRVNAHILGVALNQFDAASASRYGYDSDYYGYGSSKGYA